MNREKKRVKKGTKVFDILTRQTGCTWLSNQTLYNTAQHVHTTKDTDAIG